MKKPPKLFHGITSARSRFRKATGLGSFQITLPKSQNKPKRIFSSLLKLLKKNLPRQ